MSRTLSKILVICAMVVLFPLMIVGTTFAAYYSIDASVVVKAYTNKISNSSEAYAQVVYDGKAEQDFTITDSHMKNISLKAVSKGYDFKGWFVGDVKDYSFAYEEGSVSFVSTDAELNAAITDYEKLLAVFEIKEFDVRYSYKANPTDDVATSTTPENDDADATLRTYSYGDTLPVLTYEGSNYKFLGWRIVGDSTEKIYTTADFDFAEDITLTAVWQEQSKISVTYYKEDGTVLNTVEIYTNEHYEFEDPYTIMAENQIEAQDGYTYAWQDANGNVITEISGETENFDVYLKESLVVYNVNVNTNGAQYNGQSEVSVNFTVLDTSELSALTDGTKWATDYTFHKVTGLMYNGSSYDLADSTSSIVDAIVAAYPNGTETNLELDAVITKYFTNFTIENPVVCYTNINEIVEDVYLLNDLGSEGYKVYVTNGASTMTIGKLLGLKSDDGNVTQLYAKDSQSNNGIEVNLDGFNITIGESSKYYKVTLDMTVNDLIQLIVDNYPETELTGTFTITEIRALFK